MKKYFTYAIVAVLLFGCYDGTRVEKNPEQISYTRMVHFTEAGMSYVLFEPTTSAGGTFVINITKDSLEVETLKH